MSKQYEVLKLTAQRKGWSIPHSEVFGEQPWIEYWNLMIEKERLTEEHWKIYTRGIDPPPDFGRPVPPHRPGR